MPNFPKEIRAMYSMTDNCIDAGYAYPTLDDSDEDSTNSSDEDLDAALRIAITGRCPPVTRRRNTDVTRDESSSEDEFEKEMSSELNRTMKNIETKLHAAPSADDPMEQSSTANATAATTQTYDQEYFDSDSDDEGTSEEKKKKVHPMPSNDDLLYDPAMDEEDQKWVDKQRLGYLAQCPIAVSAVKSAPPGHSGKGGTRPTGSGPSSFSVKKLPESDAVLNCPACMSLLSRDCQRHEKYYHQYRAMFVSNCLVDTSEVLRFPDSKPSPMAKQQQQQQRKKNRKQNKRKKMDTTPPIPGVETTGDQQVCGDDSAATKFEESPANLEETGAIDCESEEVYNPVRCSECNTEVGVYDKDEIYHFFNVLSSYA